MYANCTSQLGISLPVCAPWCSLWPWGEDVLPAALPRHCELLHPVGSEITPNSFNFFSFFSLSLWPPAATTGRFFTPVMLCSCRAWLLEVGTSRTDQLPLRWALRLSLLSPGLLCRTNSLTHTAARRSLRRWGRAAPAPSRGCPARRSPPPAATPRRTASPLSPRPPGGWRSAAVRSRWAPAPRTSGKPRRETGTASASTQPSRSSTGRRRARGGRGNEGNSAAAAEAARSWRCPLAGGACPG